MSLAPPTKVCRLCALDLPLDDFRAAAYLTDNQEGATQ